MTKITQNTTNQAYSYDAFGRMDENVVSFGDTTVITNSYTYKNPSTTTSTSQIASHTIDAASYDKSYAYTYDANGNIASVKFDGNTTTYVYDSANQLVRENNQAAGKTWVYSYDKGGKTWGNSTG